MVNPVIQSTTEPEAFELESRMNPTRVQDGALDTAESHVLDEDFAPETIDGKLREG